MAAEHTSGGNCDSLPLAGTRILVMDDEACIRDLVSLILERQGARVDTASHGQEALTKCLEAHRTARPYRAVILDLSVGRGLGGVETLRQMEEHHCQTTAIVISGFHYHPAVIAYRDFGFQGALVKPFECSDLVALVQRLLSGSENTDTHHPV